MKKTNLLDIEVTSLSESQRFNLLRKESKNKAILKYLKNKLEGLFIEIGAEEKRNIINLMNRGLLEGWCWQTTESAIVFFNDDDYIERGSLNLGSDIDRFFLRKYFKAYWHSWICFTYDNEIWVFDPCLRIIVRKDLYYHIFEIKNVAGRVTAKDVRENLIFRINNKKRKSFSHFLSKYVSSDIIEKQKNETIVEGNEDTNSPMYRNFTGYTATFDDNGIIKTLIAHYYFNG